MTFAMRYHYSVVLLEQKNRKGGAFTRIYTREKGIVEGLSPGAAATILEMRYFKKNQVMDTIVLRLGHSTGSIVFETQDREEDLTPQTKQIVPITGYAKQQVSDLDLMIDKPANFVDYWKWCTQIYGDSQRLRKTLNVEECFK